MERRLDIAYSLDDPDVRRIDVFLPGQDANGAGIFFIHGGGWHAGDKESWHSVMEHFCGLGYVCTSAEYHLAPQWKLPKQAEDLRTAMAFVKAHADDYGFDPARVAVWGSSAGAHLAALLATTQPEAELGMTPEIVDRDTLPAAAVCLCSIFSFHHAEGTQEMLTKAICDVMGGTEAERPDLYRQASPIDRLCGKEPPFLMVVGDADDLTPVARHEAMRDAVIAQGGSAELVVLPGVGHGFGYGVTSEAQKQNLAHTERFLASVLALG
jgi:acetyl esterase/lipase